MYLILKFGHALEVVGDMTLIALSAAAFCALFAAFEYLLDKLEGGD
jgi:hypothetical protein